MSVNFVNNLTFSILNELYASPHPIENVVFSGIGLYIVLGAINFGLMENSYHQLSDYLREDLSELYDPTVATSITAKNWKYIRLLAQSCIDHQSTLFTIYDLFQYYTHVSALVFDLFPYQVILSDRKLAAIQINELISNLVYESVGDLVDEWALSEDKLIVIYTFYFHKDWETSFDPELTKQDFFYLDKDRPIIVHMMNQKGYHHIIDSYYSNFRMIFKPYTQEELFAVIIVPKDGYSIQDMLYKFKVDQLENYFKKSHFEYVHLKLPKFKLFHDIDLVRTLKKFGITYIFDRNMSDFGSMTNESVYIGDFIQVANLEIFESADSNFQHDISMTSELIDDAYEFFVTKPFLFLVYSYSENVVLISAIVTNPSVM